MHTDPQQAVALDFAGQVWRLYAALASTAPVASDPESEPSLGGRLLYAAELDTYARALVVAANIAGAASLSATDDRTAQKQAIRDGVVDFLVNSLDEALRILKNEIRKHETVAVCVAAAAEAIEREMLERGVLPDLLPPASSLRPNGERFLKQGARRIEIGTAREDEVLVGWQVSAAPARWLPQIDAIALGGLSVDDLVSRRWLRLAPRYLGRLAQGLHLLACGQASAERLIDAVRGEIDSGNIPVTVDFLLRGPGSQPKRRLRFEKL
jgi:hypothetical protein